MTDVESFDFFPDWPDERAKAAACVVLRDSFRRRGVNRYVFAMEGWVGKTAGIAPIDDRARGECAVVIAVERNGSRKWARAEIARNGEGEIATLGPWEVKSDVPRSRLAELLEDGHSDRSPKTEPPPLARLPDFQDLVDEDPEQAAGILESLEIHDQLADLMADQVQKYAGEDSQAIFLALESVLLSIVKDMGSPKSFGKVARFLRDHPDRFPMFPTVRYSLPSAEPLRGCKATLRGFICEKRKVGHTDSVICGAFMKMYMHLGSHAIGALNLADRIEEWDPEYQAKLWQVGLRSSYELDDEEGRVFIALSADRYPIGVMGRRNAIGDLFVSRMIACPHSDFATAVDGIKQKGFDLILGSEAKELLCKLEQVKGVAKLEQVKGDAPPADKEIWEVENWGPPEWSEQVMAELVFAKVMNIQFVPDNKLDGNVAGFRVRCARNGFVLVPSDGDEDIFVAVRVERTKQGAWARVLGWLRGSEAKLPQFYQKNCWVIPLEALHDMEKLPGKERLRAMPPYKDPDLSDEPTDD